MANGLTKLNHAIKMNFQPGLKWLMLTIKVALCSFTIARVLRTKAQIICMCSKENVSVFGYFIKSACAQNRNLTLNFLAFPSVKFLKKFGRLVVLVNI